MSCRNTFITVDNVGNIFQSEDGSNWTLTLNGSDSSASPNFGMNYYDSIGKFYGVEQYEELTYYVVSSTDLVSWTQSTYPPAIEISLSVAFTYGNGIFLTCGNAIEYSGICLSSTDTNSWETVLIFQTSLQPPSIAFDGSNFYVGVANMTTEVLNQ